MDEENCPSDQEDVNLVLIESGSTSNLNSTSTSASSSSTSSTLTSSSLSVPLPHTVGQIANQIPEMKIKAGPRDGTKWSQRLKEELAALIYYVQRNKELDSDWFIIEPQNKSRTKWQGKCWYYFESLKYEFALEFEIPVGYPMANPELKLPELDGKTSKMYHGGKICLDIHFQPLWRQKSGRFSIAHALALGLAPWLSAEVPILVARGVITAVN